MSKNKEPKVPNTFSKPVIMKDDESRHYDIGSHSSQEDKDYYRRLLTWFICMIGLGIGVGITDIIYNAIRYSGICNAINY